LKHLKNLCNRVKSICRQPRKVIARQQLVKNLAPLKKYHKNNRRNPLQNMIRLLKNSTLTKRLASSDLHPLDQEMTAAVLLAAKERAPNRTVPENINVKDVETIGMKIGNIIAMIDAGTIVIKTENLTDVRIVVNAGTVTIVSRSSDRRPPKFSDKRRKPKNSLSKQSSKRRSHSARIVRYWSHGCITAPTNKICGVSSRRIIAAK
jgi:hypothetical protein